MAPEYAEDSLFAPLFEDVKSTLDELFRETAHYKNTQDYQTLLKYILRFPALAPYNAFLLHIQNPGACFVANARYWRERFGRQIVPGARPMVVLIPFGPVDFVYDIIDTEGGEPLPEALSDPFKATGELPAEVWDYTLLNCQRDLVSIREVEMNTGSAGAIKQSYNSGRMVFVRLKGKRKTDPRSPMKALYRLVLNKNLNPATKYATLVHELAHLYCGHLGTPCEKWWPNRVNNDDVRNEFEAESVSFIVCGRLGIQTPSAAYLADYYTRHRQIPNVSLETIFKAAGLIERMGWEELEPRNYDELVLPRKRPL